MIGGFQNIYFLGIGGIGMSALARYFKINGKNVAGYDKTETPLTCDLVKEGMDVHYTDDINLIPAKYLNPEDTCVVITPAIPVNHLEWQYFIEKGFTIVKRSAVLGMITRNSKTVAISGTHGKTTTTTITSHILMQSELKCNAFLGGISKNYNSNLLLAKSDYTVVEADEYDRSFLQLNPEIAVITSIDAENIQSAFYDFVERINKNGTLIYKKGILFKPEKVKNIINIYNYSIVDENADFYATDIEKLDNGCYSFSFVSPYGRINDLKMGVPGIMNLENTVAALSVASILSLPLNSVKDAVATFSGVKRRFDYQINTPSLVFIDDYAHHPEELKACISSARKIYPDRFITGIFQPHLYSRTSDFAKEFATSLDLLDEVILLDIYPARELPIEGVSSKIIFDKIKKASKGMCKKDDLITYMKNKPYDVLITMGAGSIDELVVKIKKEIFNVE